MWQEPQGSALSSWSTSASRVQYHLPWQELINYRPSSLSLPMVGLESSVNQRISLISRLWSASTIGVWILAEIIWLYWLVSLTASSCHCTVNIDCASFMVSQLIATLHCQSESWPISDFKGICVFRLLKVPQWHHFLDLRHLLLCQYIYGRSVAIRDIMEATSQSKADIPKVCFLPYRPLWSW